MVAQQLSYKLNQVAKSGDTRLGSDPQLYVAMLHVLHNDAICSGQEVNMQDECERPPKK